MPHCIVEYSKPIESQLTPAKLLDTIFSATAASGLFDVSHIKVRALAFDHFQLAGPCADFIHITVRLHQGRTDAEKKQLSQLMLAEIVQLELNSVAITVELLDMHTASYAKRLMP